MAGALGEHQGLPVRCRVLDDLKRPRRRQLASLAGREVLADELRRRRARLRVDEPAVGQEQAEGLGVGVGGETRLDAANDVERPDVEGPGTRVLAVEERAPAVGREANPEHRGGALEGLLAAGAVEPREARPIGVRGIGEDAVRRDGEGGPAHGREPIHRLRDGDRLARHLRAIRVEALRQERALAREDEVARRHVVREGIGFAHLAGGPAGLAEHDAVATIGLAASGRDSACRREGTRAISRAARRSRRRAPAPSRVRRPRSGPGRWRLPRSRRTGSGRPLPTCR